MKTDFHSEVIYQIYPKSFCDTSGNGYGDLKGIIKKLDYLSNLGITTIWLSPVFLSPMKDNGYDIADYYKVDPIFGTNDDLYQLINKAKKYNLKIMLDLVVNHTSDQHEWFQQSKSSTTNKYRDYYIWRKEPNEIGSIFLGSAWEKDDETEEYYFHLFTKEQPDLNWANPEVRQEIYNMMNFWIEKGVAGFRMDVIEFLGKDVDQKITSDGPHLHDYIQEMNRKTFGPKGCFTVGESWSATEESERLYTLPSRNELSMIFRFDHMTTFWDDKFGKWVQKPFDLVQFKKILCDKQQRNPHESWNTLFWGNHDLPRSASTFLDSEYRVEGSKMLFALTSFMSGTPYIYQGEEIGMTNLHFDIDEFKDVEAINALQMLQNNGFNEQDALSMVNTVARDNARTPMQWDTSENAGFSSVTPWIKVNPNYQTINVKNQLDDPFSVLHFYRTILGIRKNKKYLNTILYGSFEQLYTESKQLFGYQRSTNNQTLTIIANFSNKKAIIDTLNIEGNLLVNNYQKVISSALEPYQILVFENNN